MCEAHYHPGGAAHAFEVQGYTFDSGPSFFAGLSGAPGTSTNPLKQVLDVIDEQVECVTYDRVRDTDIVVYLYIAIMTAYALCIV